MNFNYISGQVFEDNTFINWYDVYGELVFKITRKCLYLQNTTKQAARVLCKICKKSKNSVYGMDY